MKMKKCLLASLFILLLAFGLLPPAFANAAEPPGLMVIVISPPEDLALSLRFPDGGSTTLPQTKESKMWTSVFRFFYDHSTNNRPSFTGAVLVAESGGESFEMPLPDTVFRHYSNLLTLNYKDRSLIVGRSPGRTALLISLRVGLTLLIEGLILLIFGYRRLRSWLAFALINLATQGGLNILISGSLLGGYWFYTLIFFEFIICIVEMVAFSLAAKEHTKQRSVLYVLTANTVSFVLGSIFLSVLPV